MTAAHFSAGRWEEVRDAELARRVSSIQKPIHKQVGHLTVSRPLPAEVAVYRPDTYRPLVADLLTLLEQFAGAIDERVAGGWCASVASLRRRTDPEDWL